MGDGAGTSRRELLIGVSAAVVFFAIGAVLVYVGFHFYGKAQALRERGAVAEGVILRYEKRGPDTRNIRDKLWVPIVMFRTEDGREFIVEGRVDDSSFLKDLRGAGEKVEVIYEPGNPENALINTFAELWFIPFITWIVGFGFMLIPPFTIRKHLREQKRK